MKAAALLFLVALGCAAPAAAQNPFETPGQPVVIGQGYDVPSVAMGQTRRVNIMLPPDYGDPKQQAARYPVLYLLDGGDGWQDFAHIASMVRQGSLWGGGNQPMIVVGVESKDRRAELTQPSSDPSEQKDFPTHGHSEQFRRFLVEELKPQIDAAYRTNGTDGLIGESLAGLFVADTALRHGGDFDRYIAVSPSLWWSGQALSREAAALLEKPNQPPRVLWLSLADEGTTMQEGLDRLVAALKAHPNAHITWTYTPYPHESHSTIYHPAATRAVREVFPAAAEKKP